MTGVILKLRALAALLTVGIISGCGNEAAPNFYNGGYYMAGDKTCTRINAIGPDRVMCYDKAGNPTGYRVAMTTQQLQMYAYNRQRQSAEMDAFLSSSQAASQSMLNSSQAMLRSTSMYQAPQVMPIQPARTNVIHCINAGPMINCR